jgi:hypothetical protein
VGHVYCQEAAATLARLEDLPSTITLAMIGEQPRHGYELMRAIEDRVGGSYSPIIDPAKRNHAPAGVRRR